jgi:hypothetical protein
MRIQVDDVKLFFDVEGAKLRPGGQSLRQVPTLQCGWYSSKANYADSGFCDDWIESNVQPCLSPAKMTQLHRSLIWRILLRRCDRTLSGLRVSPARVMAYIVIGRQRFSVSCAIF